MQKQPWEIKQTTSVHRNPFYAVVREDFRLASGEAGAYYLVDVPDFVALIAQAGDCTYWADLFRYTLRAQSLELPMGAIEKNESSLEAARRELREEIGIEAKHFSIWVIWRRAKDNPRKDLMFGWRVTWSFLSLDRIVLKVRAVFGGVSLPVHRWRK